MLKKSTVQILNINGLGTHNRHADHVILQEPGGSVPILEVNSYTNGKILDHTESISNTEPDRHMVDLKGKHIIHHGNLDSHLSYEHCGICYS